LTRFADNTFTTLVTSADFPAGRVTAIVEDDDGILWVGTGSGILRIEKAEFDRSAVNSSHQIRYRMYDRSNGLAGFPLAPTLLGGNRGAIRAPDGRLWFLTMRGVTFIDPRAFREAPRPAPVHIQTVSVDGQPLHSPLQTRLPAGSRKLEIDYGLLDLTTPSSTEFRYRLEGFESDWTHAGTRQQAFYTDLAPGRYRFHVVSNNDDGVWAEPGATWEFSVTPMFYQTTWFYVAIGLNVALALWASWRFHLRRVKKEFALILGERTRLSREIHDTLLQSLVGVALQCEALADGLDPSPDAARQQLVRMRRQVEEYIREARQSIWNLRSAKLETTDLVEALREAGQQAAEGRGVDFTLSVHGTPQPCSRKLHNELFRIGQEATLNAIRHAQANQVRMVLEYDHDSVALRVSDDGCGFDPASFAPDDHYGLEGMKERAKNVGGKLKIMSKVGRGTEIETVVPIHTSS
jgi:signal transduction histidine kinase